MRKYIDLIESMSEKSYPVRGGEVLIKVRLIGENRYLALAFINGEQVAIGEFQSDGSGGGWMDEILVFPRFRRLGIASAIYDFFKDMGVRISKSNNVKPDGEAFWKSRDGY